MYFPPLPDAIAKRAGVGALYRRFPNREAHLGALLEARDVELERQRDAIRQEAPDAATALDGWLDALTDWASAFDGLPEPLRVAMSVEASPLALTCQGYITTTDDFLADGRPTRGQRMIGRPGARALPRGPGHQLGP